MHISFCLYYFMPMVAFEHTHHIMQGQFCAIKKQKTKNGASDASDASASFYNAFYLEDFTLVFNTLNECKSYLLQHSLILVSLK